MHGHGSSELRSAWTALFVLVTTAVAAHAGPLEDANAAHERGDDETAIRLIRPLADQGNAIAEFDLGMMYDSGLGVPQDYAEAAKWYRRAGDQGYAEAQLSLGVRYHWGRGVPQDDAEAMKWYRLAASQGHVGAQYNIGLAFANGFGVAQNFVEAMKWYRPGGRPGFCVRTRQHRFHVRQGSRRRAELR